MRFSLCQWPLCISMRCRTLSSLIPTQQGPIHGAPLLGALWEVPCILQTGRPCRVYCGIRGVKGAAAGGSGGSWGRGSHGKGPPKAWNAGEVSRGWCGGNQRSSPGMEQVLLCSPSGIKDVTRLKRLVLALQSEHSPPNTYFFFGSVLVRVGAGVKVKAGSHALVFRGQFLYLNGLQRKRGPWQMLKVKFSAP